MSLYNLVENSFKTKFRSITVASLWKKTFTLSNPRRYGVVVTSMNTKLTIIVNYSSKPRAIFLRFSDLNFVCLKQIQNKKPVAHLVNLGRFIIMLSVHFYVVVKSSASHSLSNFGAKIFFPTQKNTSKNISDRHRQRHASYAMKISICLVSENLLNFQILLGTSVKNNEDFCQIGHKNSTN